MKAYVNIDPVSDMPSRKKQSNVPAKLKDFNYGIQGSEWEVGSYPQ
jgi:hypothetical protein